MKLLKQIVVVAVLAYVMALFLPWWNVAIAGFIGGLAFKRSFGGAFLGSFLGVFILWTAVAMIIAYSTGSPLPDRVGHLISPSINGTLLALISGTVGGLVAGIAGMAARAFRGPK